MPVVERPACDLRVSVAVDDGDVGAVGVSRAKLQIRIVPLATDVEEIHRLRDLDRPLEARDHLEGVGPLVGRAGDHGCELVETQGGMSH